MPDSQNREAISDAINRYFRALASGDLSGIAFTPDVQFQSPLNPATPTVGIDAVTALLSTFGAAIERIEIQDKVIEGQTACVTFIWFAVSGTEIAMCDYFRFEGDQIAYLRPYFDTRLLTSE